MTVRQASGMLHTGETDAIRERHGPFVPFHAMRTVRRSLLLALTILAFGLPPVLAATPHAKDGVPDPATAGSLEPVRAEYDAGPTIVNDPKGATYLAEIKGVTWYPKTGKGPFPVLILLHGNHGTCTAGGADGSAFPCPTTPATADIPSYAGYDYLASNLASHGYVVTSIDANGVNTYNVAGDKGANERAQLIARTLDLLSSWNRAAAPAPINTHLV